MAGATLITDMGTVPTAAASMDMALTVPKEIAMVLTAVLTAAPTASTIDTAFMARAAALMVTLVAPMVTLAATTVLTAAPVAPRKAVADPTVRTVVEEDTTVTASGLTAKSAAPLVACTACSRGCSEVCTAAAADVAVVPTTATPMPRPRPRPTPVQLPLARRTWRATNPSRRTSFAT